jgi:hypothetical protein
MMTRTAVNVIHAFVVAPLLIYVGLKCKDVPRPATISVLALGIIALVYHLYGLVRDVRDQRIAQMSEVTEKKEGFASCGAKRQEGFASCGARK